MGTESRNGNRRELVVVGAGPGGYTAAFRAAELGLKVTMIDPEQAPGGTCLYRGCIPSKALLHVSHLITAASDASEIGLVFEKPKINFEQIRSWKNEVVESLTSALAKKAEKLKIEHIRGIARFKDANNLTIRDSDGAETELSFDMAIVATGSRPVPFPGLEETGQRIIDSTSALELQDIPDSLLVIGGGYIGLELGSVYAALGTEVSIVEMTEDLLPQCDNDLVSQLNRRLKGCFSEIKTGTSVVHIKEQKNGVMVTLKDKGKDEQRKLYDRVLVAIGRRPNSDGLKLEKAGIEVTDKGFVKVDAQMRTSESHIFAIGDLAGEPMLAHKAYAEATVAAEVAAGRKSQFDPRAVPAVVFTNPEIAWCGLTEIEAKEKGIAVKTVKMSWRGNGRALSLGRTDGMTKFLVDPETERILGVAFVGPGASELIAEGALALEMAAVCDDVANTIHPHPTLSETMQDVARMIKAKQS